MLFKINQEVKFVFSKLRNYDILNKYGKLTLTIFEKTEKTKGLHSTYYLKTPNGETIMCPWDDEKPFTFIATELKPSI